jgi:hypothetical protein
MARIKVLTLPELKPQLLGHPACGNTDYHTPAPALSPVAIKVLDGYKISTWCSRVGFF